MNRLVTILEHVKSGEVSIETAEKQIKTILGVCDTLNEQQMGGVSTILHDIAKEAFITGQNYNIEFEAWWKERNLNNLN